MRVGAFQRRSSRRASAESGSDISRYSAAHSVPGMTQLPRFVAKICVCFVSSRTVSTETSDESLSRATKSLVIGASARRKACGPRTSVRTWRSRQPERSRRLELARRDGFERRAIDLALVGGVVQRQAEQRRDEGRQPDRRGDAVVEDEQLEQDRRAAHQLDIAGQRRRSGAVAVDAPGRDERRRGRRRAPSTGTTERS